MKKPEPFVETIRLNSKGYAMFSFPPPTILLPGDGDDARAVIDWNDPKRPELEEAARDAGVDDCEYYFLWGALAQTIADGIEERKEGTWKEAMPMALIVINHLRLRCGMGPFDV